MRKNERVCVCLWYERVIYFDLLVSPHLSICCINSFSFSAMPTLLSFPFKQCLYQILSDGMRVRFHFLWIFFIYSMLNEIAQNWMHFDENSLVSLVSLARICFSESLCLVNFCFSHFVGGYFWLMRYDVRVERQRSFRYGYLSFMLWVMTVASTIMRCIAKGTSKYTNARNILISINFT